MFNVYPSHDNCPVHMVCDILLLCLLPQYAQLQQDAAADLDLDNDIYIYLIHNCTDVQQNTQREVHMGLSAKFSTIYKIFLI